jgi:hypothetical protein
MSIQLGSAYGKVVIDSSGVTIGVGNATKSLGSLADIGMRVGASMQQVGQSMTIGLTLPILAAGAASIKAASDLEETRNKVKVVFGDMSDDMLKWGDNAALAFGQSKQQALEAAGTFGNLFTSMGLGREASADMSQGLVELAADLASFNNIDPALVLEKLRSGLVGEVEPLRTLGINLTMAAVKAKAMEMGLADASGEVSQAALLQARYALMLEQSTNAQGDFARTSDGLANSSRIMTAQMKDAAAALGQNLLPMALAVVQGLNKMLTAFNSAPPFVQKAIVVFLGLLAVLGPIISILGWVVSMISTVSSVAGALGISFGGVAAAASAAGTAALAAGAAIASVALPILLIIGTLVLLYLAFKNNWFGITDTVKQAWFLIGYYINMGINRLRSIFANFNLLEAGRNMMRGLANGIMSGISWIVEAAIKAGQAALAAIKRALGISSPSKEFMKLGVFSAQGFSAGLATAMDPNAIARTMAKPAQNMSSNQSTSNTINLSGGLTLRDVDALMSQRINQFTKRLDRAMGGA